MKKAEATTNTLETVIGLGIGIVITIALFVMIAKYKCFLISCEPPCLDDQSKATLDSFIYQIVDAQTRNIDNFKSSISLNGDNCAMVGFFLSGSTGDIATPDDLTTQLKQDTSFLCICEFDDIKNSCTENKYCNWISNINSISMNDNGNPFVRKSKDRLLKEFEVSLSNGNLDIHNTNIDLEIYDEMDYDDREIAPGITNEDYLSGKSFGTGDLNKDGTLDSSDFNIMNKIITGTFSGYTIDTYPEADLNGDKKIDINDKNILNNLVLTKEVSVPVKIQKDYSYEELTSKFGDPDFNKEGKDLYVTKYYISCEEDYKSWSAFAKDVKIQGSGFSNENKLCRYTTVSYGKDRCYNVKQDEPLKIGAGGRAISPFRTLAGHPDDFGKTVYIYYSENNPYNGCYVVEDTGGQNYFRWEGNQLEKQWQPNPKGWKYKKLDLFAGKCKSELNQAYKLAPSAYPKIWVVDCEPEPLRLWHSDNSVVE